MLALNFILLRASIAFVATQSFLLSMLSVTSLTASIAFVYTLPTFLRKSSVQTNAKNLLGEPKPLEWKSQLQYVSAMEIKIQHDTRYKK